MLDALEDFPAQAGTLGTIHRVPVLDESSKIAEFSSARCAQIRQNFGIERHSVALLLWWLKSLDEGRGGHLAFLFVLGQSEQLAALLGGGDAPWWRLGS